MVEFIMNILCINHSCSSGILHKQNIRNFQHKIKQKRNSLFISLRFICLATAVKTLLCILEIYATHVNQFRFSVNCCKFISMQSFEMFFFCCYDGQLSVHFCIGKIVFKMFCTVKGFRFNEISVIRVHYR